MTLRYLEIFLALARTPNMRDAAAKLFISQAAVSSALRDFEAELGVSLFDRMGRGIRLNDKGRLLEERLAPLYNQLKNVLALVASDELAGKIRIGASTTLSDFVLPQVLYNFKMRHHQVEIECESGNTADIVRHVEHGLLDVGFVEGDVHNLAVEIPPRQGIPCDRHCGQGIGRGRAISHRSSARPPLAAARTGIGNAGNVSAPAYPARPAPADPSGIRAQRLHQAGSPQSGYALLPLPAHRAAGSPRR